MPRLAPLVVLLGPALAGPLGAAEPPRISPADRARVAASFRTAEPDPGTGAAVTGPGAGTTYRVLNMEFEDAAAAAAFRPPAGAAVFHRFDRFADLFVETEAALDGCARAAGVRWVDAAGFAQAPPPPDLVPSGEKGRGAEEVVRGGRAGLTGKGVVVVVIDSGIDFRHPDFTTPGPDGRPTSRLLYFWDTVTPPAAGGAGGPAPLRYPNGAPVGTLFTRDELTADLRAPAGRVPQLDTNGHGTACAGIAAGNGRALGGRHAGVAPAADLVGVRIGPGPDLPNAYLLNAVCAWADDLFPARPVVISCSFSAQQGGHDGQRVAERQLSERFGPDRKGRLVCVAAGNEGGQAVHAGGRATPARPAEFRWESKRGGQVALYAAAPDGVELDVVPVAGPAPTRFRHPLCRGEVIEFEVPPGGGGVRVRPTAGGPVKVDAFVVADRGGTRFAVGPGAPRGTQVGTPGTAANVLTVGSFDFNDEFEGPAGPVTLGTQGAEVLPLALGRLSGYSNPGPARLGGPWKPDLAAPGQYFAAPALTAGPVRQRDRSGKYRLFNGTSAATPYAAGVMALLLEKNPTLTLARVRGAMNESGEMRRHITPPVEGWGYGKLTAAAVDELIAKAAE